MINYGKQWIDDQDIASVLEVLKSDFLTQGPKVKAFEETLAEITGARYCVAVANGTAALHLAVAALKIPADKNGITSAITFAASANSMLYSGLKPGFCDVDPNTICLDPEDLKNTITPDTELVIPVHFAGLAADMNSISTIARKHNIRIIEDAAHAIGSRYHCGSRIGSCKYSDLTTFSFHPVKTVTTAEGGAITTNDEELYNRLLLLRNHGITKNPATMEQNEGPWYYEMQTLGFNYRLTDLHAALGLSQLSKLDHFRTRRQEIVDIYNNEFETLDPVKRPVHENLPETAWHLHVIQIDFQGIGKSRAQVMAELREEGIGTQVHYIPVYRLPYYKNVISPDQPELSAAEHYYAGCLSIPLYPAMSDSDVQKVVNSVKKVVG